MRLTLNKKVNFQDCKGSDRSNVRNNSKKKFTVTLSQQKKQTQHPSCLQNSNPHPIFDICKTQTINNTKSNNIHQNNLFRKQSITPQKTNNQNKQIKTSLQPTAIGMYFVTNQQKHEAKRQSMELDEHIKRLQQQIQNTRSKITQTKYLYQQSHNKNKSTIQGSTNQTSILHNSNNDNKASISTTFNRKSSIKTNQTLNYIPQSSPQIYFIQSNQQRYPISPTPSEPIHPFLLKKMLPLSKQQKNHHLSLNCFNHQHDKYQEKQGHKNTISVYSKNYITQKSKKQNKKYKTLDFSNNPTTSKLIGQSIITNHPQTHKKTAQKRAFSINFQNKIIKKDKKSYKNRSSQSQNKIKMNKNNKQKSKPKDYLRIDQRKSEKFCNISIFNQMQIKKQSAFVYDILEKKVPSNKKKLILVSK